MHNAIKYIIFFVFIINATGYATTKNCPQQQCIAVVDVGSGGSRIHIYSYNLDNNHSPTNVTEFWSKKIKPGFATIETNQAAVDGYLSSLFADSPISHISVYFFATAGMRLLPKSQQQVLHTLVQQWFSKQTDWQLSSSKTITGSEEGLFGWLAVNYQLGILTQNQEPIGVLDIGGTSTQVVFPVKNNHDINSKDILQFKLYGKKFKLFIHSFLGLGQTEISRQFLNSTSCFITNYPMQKGQLAEGDAYACKKEVASLMNNVHRVNKIVQPALATNPVKNWYIMGGIVELVKSQPFNFTSQEFTNQALLKKANSKICHKQWPILNAQFPGNDYLYGYCFFPSYFYALLVDGYGLSPQQKLNYLSANRNNDWTMGVVLYLQAKPRVDEQNFSIRPA